MLLSAQGIPGHRSLESDDRWDLAGVGRRDVLAAVGMHLDQPADTLTALLGGVVDGLARLQGAGVDPDK